MRIICELEARKPGLTNEIYQEIEGEAKALLDEMIKAGLVKNQFQASAILQAYFLFGKTQTHWETFRDLVGIADPEVYPFNGDLAGRVDSIKGHLQELLPDSDRPSIILDHMIEQLSVQALNQISTQDPLSNFCRLVTDTKNPVLADILRENKN